MKPKNKKKIEGGVVATEINLSDRWFNEQYAIAAKQPPSIYMSASGHYLSAKQVAKALSQYRPK